MTKTEIKKADILKAWEVYKAEKRTIEEEYSRIFARLRELEIEHMAVLNKLVDCRTLARDEDIEHLLKN